MQNVPINALKISTENLALKSLDLRGSWRPSGCRLKNRSIREPADDEVVVEDVHQMERQPEPLRERPVQDYGVNRRVKHRDSGESSKRSNGVDEKKKGSQRGALELRSMRLGG